MKAKRPLDLMGLIAIEGVGPKSARALHDALGVRTLADLERAEREGKVRSLRGFGQKSEVEHLRRIALVRGFKLNEYDLFQGEEPIAGRTEEELYQALGLPFIAPELREDRGEIEAAREGRLPNVIGYGDLKGDLQIQTDWTDGKHSIEAMAAEARAKGLEYIAITDHTASLAMMGMDESKLALQMEAIAATDRKLSGIRILTGAEVNIMPDGSLDVSDLLLSKLDVVGVGVHSHFHQTRSQMTERLCRAMRNPNVDILFHPTGRILQKRDPYHLDFDEVLRVAKETATVPGDRRDSRSARP